MFVTYRILEMIASTKDNAHALSLSAFHDAHNLAIGAKNNEIAALQQRIDELNQQLSYEKKRGDQLVDRLLQKEAHVAAVAPMAEHLVKHQDEEMVKKLKVVFDEINSVGQEVPTPEPRVFEMAGGKAIEK
jgi:cell division septum initiation protein DivIVA